jgi:hypothetical protein
MKLHLGPIFSVSIQVQNNFSYRGLARAFLLERSSLDGQNLF